MAEKDYFLIKSIRGVNRQLWLTKDRIYLAWNLINKDLSNSTIKLIDNTGEIHCYYLECFTVLEFIDIWELKRSGKPIPS